MTLSHVRQGTTQCYGYHDLATQGNRASAWWRHQMENFSALLALCAGNSPVPVNSPHKGQWRGALMFSLIYAWINDWVNNREAGDLRRQRGHYDVIVMVTMILIESNGDNSIFQVKGFRWKRDTSSVIRFCKNQCWLIVNTPCGNAVKFE